MGTYASEVFQSISVAFGRICLTAIAYKRLNGRIPFQRHRANSLFWWTRQWRRGSQATGALPATVDRPEGFPTAFASNSRSDHEANLEPFRWHFPVFGTGMS